jgi:hypothetical protein
MVGPNGLEPLTSSLSEKRSNHLSYDPILQFKDFNIFRAKLLVIYIFKTIIKGLGKSTILAF